VCWLDIGGPWDSGLVGAFFLPSDRMRWRSGMEKRKALSLLKANVAEVRNNFGVTRLALFGSTARGEGGEHSDVDVLVAFDGPATSARYFGLLFFLEDLLGCPVDLVTEKALRAELRPYVERELISVG
jgi:predicted nucleotidyltransferase